METTRTGVWLAALCAAGAVAVACASTNSASADSGGTNLPAPAGTHVTERPPMPVGMDFSDAERWAAQFEDPARDEWQKPDAVLDRIGLTPTDVVVDVGSATGYFAVRTAHRVPEGKVYGVDIEPNMVAYLNARAEREGLDNLVSIVSGGPVVVEEPVDVVLIVNTYHHLPNRPDYFAQLQKGLSERGRVVIVDFRQGHMASFNPEDAAPAAHHARLTVAQISAELAQAGFVLASHDAELLPRKNFLVFRPQ